MRLIGTYTMPVAGSTAAPHGKSPRTLIVVTAYPGVPAPALGAATACSAGPPASRTPNPATVTHRTHRRAGKKRFMPGPSGEANIRIQRITSNSLLVTAMLPLQHVSSSGRRRADHQRVLVAAPRTRWCPATLPLADPATG